VRKPLIVLTVAAALWAGMRLDAQGTDAASAGALLDVVESLLKWAPPQGEIDIRIAARSPLGPAPRPVARITGTSEVDLVATVSEWGTPPPAELTDRRVFTFLYPPTTCDSDQETCVGRPLTASGPQVKAIWLALILARNCSAGPNAVSDGDDLFVRGIDRGAPLTFFCSRPQRTGPTPADRQAAAIVRMMHTLLGRYPVRERRHP